MIISIGVFFFLLILIPVIDFIWLAKIMSGFYLAELGPLARQEAGRFAPLIAPAILVYIALSLGIVAFVLPRLEPSGSLLTTFLWGALFGVVVYAIYDMTNLSLVQNWSLKMSLVDMAWGGVLCGISTIAAQWAQNLAATWK